MTGSLVLVVQDTNADLQRRLMMMTRWSVVLIPCITSSTCPMCSLWWIFSTRASQRRTTWRPYVLRTIPFSRLLSVLVLKPRRECLTMLIPWRRLSYWCKAQNSWSLETSGSIKVYQWVNGTSLRDSLGRPAAWHMDIRSRIDVSSFPRLH